MRGGRDDSVQAPGDQLLDQLGPGRLVLDQPTLAAKGWHCLRTARFDFGYSMRRAQHMQRIEVLTPGLCPRPFAIAPRGDRRCDLRHPAWRSE